MSEKMGPLSGEESNEAAAYGLSEALDDDSDIPREAGRLRRIASSTFGSIISRLRSSHPFLALNCASARRFCRVRAICRYAIRPFQCMAYGHRGAGFGHSP